MISSRSWKREEPRRMKLMLIGSRTKSTNSWQKRDNTALELSSTEESEDSDSQLVSKRRRTGDPDGPFGRDYITYEHFGKETRTGCIINIAF